MRVKRPKGILFDNDGVLISSEELHFMAWKQMLHRHGFPYEKIEWNTLVGQTSLKIIAQLLDQFKPGWKAEEYDLEALAKEKNDIYLEMAKTHLALYPGVPEGLAWLQEQKISAAIVSNAKRRELVFSVDTLKTGKYFQAIISRDDATHPKPHPAMYELGALSLSLTPNECIAIDDSPTGLQSALLAGCVVASITTNYPREFLETPVPGRPDLRPVWIGESTSQFFEWLRSLPE